MLGSGNAQEARAVAGCHYVCSVCNAETAAVMSHKTRADNHQIPGRNRLRRLRCFVFASVLGTRKLRAVRMPTRRNREGSGQTHSFPATPRAWKQSSHALTCRDNHHIFASCWWLFTPGSRLAQLVDRLSQEPALLSCSCGLIDEAAGRVPWTG